jgi:uncharacterized membrane protein
MKLKSVGLATSGALLFLGCGGGGGASSPQPGKISYIIPSGSPGSTEILVGGVSPGGTYVVGSQYINGNNEYATIWEGGIPTLVPLPNGVQGMFPSAISADGTMIAGTYQLFDENSFEDFFWSQKTGFIQVSLATQGNNLGILGPRAVAIDPNGNVTYQGTPTQFVNGAMIDTAVWSLSTKTSTIPIYSPPATRKNQLPRGYLLNQPKAASINGTYTVGFSQNYIVTGDHKVSGLSQQAFLWNAKGIPLELPTETGQNWVGSSGEFVAETGNVAAGTAFLSGNQSDSWVWTRSLGTRNLETLLMQAGYPDHLPTGSCIVNSISLDGRFVSCRFSPNGESLQGVVIDLGSQAQ